MIFCTIIGNSLQNILKPFSLISDEQNRIYALLESKQVFNPLKNSLRVPIPLWNRSIPVVYVLTFSKMYGLGGYGVSHLLSAFPQKYESGSKMQTGRILSSQAASVTSNCPCTEPGHLWAHWRRMGAQNASLSGLSSSHGISQPPSFDARG